MKNAEDLHKHQTETETPRPLMREMPPAPPFPTDALGSTLGGAAEAIKDKTQAPDAMCGLSVLAVAALAVQGQCDVEMPTGDTKPTSNFLMSLGVSGERKTACDKLALQPVRKREESLRDSYDKDSMTYRNRQEVWESSRDKIRKERAKAKGEYDHQKSLDDLGLPPTPPLSPMLTTSDSTYEGFCRLLKEGQPSVGLFSAEGASFICGHGMNDDNKAKTATGLSSAWDGEPIRRVRAGDGIIIMPGRRASMHLMVQPDIAAFMLGDPVLAGQGFLSRMLLAAPDSTIGIRPWREPHQKSDLQLKLYTEHLLSILETPLPLREGKLNELDIQKRIPLSSEARKDWISFYNQTEEKLKAGGVYEQIRSFGAKVPEHALRLAGVLSYITNPSTHEIDIGHMEAGIALADYFAAEALRLFGASKISHDLRVAQKLLTWLHTNWQESIVSLPDIYQLGPNDMRDKASAKKAVSILEDHGHLIQVHGVHEVRGVRRKEVWRIVPAV